MTKAKTQTIELPNGPVTLELVEDWAANPESPEGTEELSTWRNTETGAELVFSRHAAHVDHPQIAQ